MGVFEMVVALVFMSFMFQLAKLHYESRGNGQTSTKPETEGSGASSLPLRGEVRGKDPARKSRRRKRYRRWALLLLAGFLLFRFFSAPAWRMVETAGRAVTNVGEKVHRLIPAPPSAPTATPAPEALALPDIPIPVDSIKPGPNEWDVTEDPDSFIADAYPGIPQCGAPMAIKIYNEVKEKLEDETKAEAADEEVLFYVKNNGLKKDDYQGFLAGFTEKMRSQVEGCLIQNVSDEDTTSLVTSNAHFLITVKANGGVVNKSRWAGPMGMMICQVKSLNETTNVMTQFRTKSWLTNAKQFVAQGARRRYFVGRCERFLADPKQAREQSLRNVRKQIAETVGRQHPVGQRYHYDVLDSFPQTYERPYGDVYRDAVLVELDRRFTVPETMSDSEAEKHVINMVEVVDSQANPSYPMEVGGPLSVMQRALPITRKWSRPSFEWCIALLVGLTVVVGTISNVLTQGYYRSEISNSVFGMVLLGFCILVILVFLWQF